MDEEIEFDEGDLLAQKEDWMESLRQCAKTSSRDATAIEKAQGIFDEMFQAYVKTDDMALFPGPEVYNLLIETHAYGSDEKGGEEAEMILSRMEDSSVAFVALPNLQTYLNVMDAWAMRKNPEKAEAVATRLNERYAETNDDAVKPTIAVTNKLIKSYGIRGDIEKAESIFRDSLEKEGELKANHKTWVQIMKAYIPQKSGYEQVGDLFFEMRKAFRMGEEEYLPKTEAYNALIRALGYKRNGGPEAEELLFEMIEQYQAGEDDVRPNADTFRNTIAAQLNRRNFSSAKVEQLLQIQEGLYMTTGFPDLKIDTRVNNAALQVMSKTKDARKAIRAKRIIENMKNSGDPENMPTKRTYRSLMSACAFTRGNPEESLETFQVAIETIKNLKEFVGEEPDSGFVGLFLKACSNLMPPSRKRDAVVEKIFEKCCADGLLNDFVLIEFEKAASETLQLETLGGFLEDNVKLPEKWSRNVPQQ
ncbi:unnamed protein product [Cylindrotheca closterium]|uniref:Pentacotripeptide-repeat region of PRORP domain-containing protein n=1 Tax=Cylindrotheca closterium TaxID=2856 RepID=A0AAD2FCQ7_9STRA|nr:unnamed protein product [Cylindrotheca closterium]